MPMLGASDILLVMVTGVTGLHCRLQRHTLTQVKVERNAAFDTSSYLT